MDTLTAEQRSFCMSRIRSRNTKAEVSFRQYLWAKGMRGYRLKAKLKGKPDLYFPTAKLAVFIDGCFWHKCPRCFVKPKSKNEYWDSKIARNTERDKETYMLLREKGISVLRLWEHEVNENTEQCYQELKRIYEKNTRTNGHNLKSDKNSLDISAQKLNNDSRRKNIMPTKKLTTIDLFAGIGGIRTGFEKAGFETLFANDVDPYCKATYDLNFKSVPLTVADISKVESSSLPDFDILLGGFPCQPFSIAGYRRGFLDTGRGDLFFEIVRILRDKKPRAVFLENVKNLRTHDKGRTFKIISDALEDLGYHTKVEVLNSMEYGNVPQNRERVYIVGFLSQEECDAFEFPKPAPLTKSVSDLLDKEVDKRYYYNHLALYPKLKDLIKSEDTVYQWRRVYVRENKKGVSPTLTANMGMGGHNVPLIKDKKGIRKFTPRECARLQGYPDSFKLPKDLPDTKLYKQMGNSVTVSVIERIAKQIAKVLQLPNYVHRETAESEAGVLRATA